MQLIFSSDQSVFVGGHAWYDSKDYSRLLVGMPSESRKKAPEAQRRLRCNASAKEIHKDSYRHYDPFVSAPTMFLEFAELDGSEESVLKFTDAYGRIWEDFSGPCLVDYRETIVDLGETVELWQAIQGGDAAKLRRHVFWDSAGRLRWKSDLSHPMQIDGKTVHFIDVRQGPRDYKCGDLVGPATDLLDFVIATRPTWDMQIKPVRRNGVLALHIEVETLLSVLWIQFALAVAAAKEYGRCQLCNRPFEMDSNRADRAFCSDNCRVKAYQRRKKQAVALREKGKSLREIVKATASDLETVKRWVTGTDAKEK